MMEKIILTAILLMESITYTQTAQCLGSYNTDADTITVSGFSSGASFSMQMHIALSTMIKGASIIAGWPYACQVNQEGYPCDEKMNNNISSMIIIAKEYEAAGLIDPLINLQGSPVYNWVHQNDTCDDLPIQFVAIEEIYEHFGVNIESQCSAPYGHCYPTLSYGHPCPITMTPYLNECNFSMAYHSLLPLIDDLLYPTDDIQLVGELYEYDQNEFVSESGPDSFDTEGGYIYIPSNCQNNETICKVHVFFHGCRMGRDYIGDVAVQKSGLLEIAEVNNIVMLFPQLFNRDGGGSCWDEFGNDGDNFATKYGVQIMTVKGMIERVLGQTTCTSSSSKSAVWTYHALFTYLFLFALFL